MSIINVLSIKQVIVFNEVEHGGVTTVFWMKRNILYLNMFRANRKIFYALKIAAFCYI